MGRLAVISALSILLSSKLSLSSPTGADAAAAAAAAIAGGALIAKVAEDECDDVGVRMTDCLLNSKPFYLI